MKTNKAGFLFFSVFSSWIPCGAPSIPHLQEVLTWFQVSLWTRSKEHGFGSLTCGGFRGWSMMIPGTGGEGIPKIVMYTLNGKLGIVVPCTDPYFHCILLLIFRSFTKLHKTPSHSTCYAIIRYLKRTGGKARNIDAKRLLNWSNVFPGLHGISAVSAGGSNKPNRQTSTITNHQPSTINPKTPIHTQNETSYITTTAEISLCFPTFLLFIEFHSKDFFTSLHATFEKGLDF